MTTTPKGNSSEEREDLSLNDAVTHLLEECRTVVPGMQALFGFQLIAVYVVAHVIVDTRGVAAAIAVALLGVFIAFWFVLPRVARLLRADSADVHSKSAHRDHGG